MSNNLIYRSKAPFRVGLAGGGTDVSPYCDIYGGAILNFTISLYAYCSIEIIEGDLIIIESVDRNESEKVPFEKQIAIDGKLNLVKGVYNCIQKDFGNINQPIKITTHTDVPGGSGLGTSSTLVVAIIGAFAEMLKLPLGEYDIAHYAYKIEREYLALAGGKQDQYSATFGGFNFMEFYDNDKVIVNPLRIKEQFAYELENNLLLYFTQTSREGDAIIKSQQKNVLEKKSDSIEAMHQLKRQAQLMKEALLKGNINEIGNILNYGFEQKIKMASSITNNSLNNIYKTALEAGATGGKISGAGGGGFMVFYCPNNTKFNVIKAFMQFDGTFYNYHVTNKGLTTWAVKN